MILQGAFIYLLLSLTDWRKVRVPLADGTLFVAPPEIPEEIVILMADIVGLFSSDMFLRGMFTDLI